MTPLHSCDFCRERKTRRKMVLLFAQSPNMTSTEAARRLDVSRSYVTQQRVVMEARGCLSRRTVDGRALRGARAKQAATLGPAWPIGTLWTTDATKRAA